MMRPNHLNADDLLPTLVEREISVGDLGDIMERFYATVSAQLEALRGRGVLYVVCGIPAAGKTTWIMNNIDHYDADAVFLDGPRITCQSRARAIKFAKASDCQSVAVWLDTPLELALQRNAHRIPKSLVSDERVRQNFALLEAPSLKEGFNRVVVVSPSEAAD